MKFSMEESVKQMTEFLKTEATTETVMGQPFQLGEFTCVPVIKFGLGLGYGGGEGEGPMDGKSKAEGYGGGAGGGIGIAPTGFLVTRGDQISFIAAQNNKGLSAAFEKVPELIEKFMDKKNKEKAAAM